MNPRSDIRTPAGEILLVGASAVDVNSDGLVDLYHHQRLYLQRPDGTFKGDSDGLAAAADDRDDDLDVFIGACSTPERSVNLLLRNNGDGTFTDVAHKVGVADDLASWGVVWVDIDNDGWQDLFIANMWLSGRSGYEKLYRSV